MATILIRTATAADLPALRQVFRAASLSNESDVPLLLAHPEFLDFSGEGIPDGRTRVATPAGAGDEPVGFATVVPDPSGDLELEDLFVDPRWHRQGIGRALVLDTADAARQRGHRRLTVTGNQDAWPFYRSLGFVEIGLVRVELGRALRLELDLAG